MSTRRLTWALLICITVVVVFSGIGSYVYERFQLKSYLADNEFQAYDYLKLMMRHSPSSQTKTRRCSGSLT
jgi:uncharacterized protein YneF (UPF0154 family)